MRPNAFVFFAIAAVLLLVAVPLLAHHSFMVGFDMSKSIVVKGIVTKVTWANPHISFYVDVTDDTGKVTTWGVDAAAPAALVARGWTRNLLKPGDVVAVQGFAARDGKPFAAAANVTLADGRTILAASDGASPK